PTLKEPMLRIEERRGQAAREGPTKAIQPAVEKRRWSLPTRSARRQGRRKHRRWSPAAGTTRGGDRAVAGRESARRSCALSRTLGPSGPRKKSNPPRRRNRKPPPRGTPRRRESPQRWM